MFQCTGVYVDQATCVRIGVNSVESHWVYTDVIPPRFLLGSKYEIPGERRCVSCQILCSTIRNVPMNQNQVHYLEGLINRHDNYEFTDELDLLQYLKSISTYIPVSPECNYARIVHQIGLHSFDTSLTNGRFDSMVLNKIDPTLGYIKGNVYPCPSTLHMVNVDIINDIASNILPRWPVSELSRLLADWCYQGMYQGFTGGLSEYSMYSDIKFDIPSFIRLIAMSGGRCALTGTKLILTSDDPTSPTFRQLAIGMKDVTEGYTIENCQLVCQGFLWPFGQQHFVGNGDHLASDITNIDTQINSDRSMYLSFQYMKNSLWSGMGKEIQAQIHIIASDIIEDDKSQWLNRLNYVERCETESE